MTKFGQNVAYEGGTLELTQLYVRRHKFDLIWS